MWGLDVGLPTHITAMGGKYLWNDSKETPELLSSVYNYPDEKKVIEFEVRPWATNREDGVKVGNIFYGDKGFVKIFGYSKYEVWQLVGKEKYEKVKEGDEGGNHFANFIDAVRAHDKSMLDGPVETAHLASGLAHLGNISYRLGESVPFNKQSKTLGDNGQVVAAFDTLKDNLKAVNVDLAENQYTLGRVLEFDAKTERFQGDEQANALLSRPYRKPFVVPEKV